MQGHWQVAKVLEAAKCDDVQVVDVASVCDFTR